MITCITKSNTGLLRGLGASRSVLWGTACTIRNESSQSEVDQEEPSGEASRYTEKEIAQIRNKSRLQPHHYNMLYDRVPPLTKQEKKGLALRAQRRNFGIAGKSSKIDPYICWPSKEEYEDLLEYEKVLMPKSISEKIQDVKQAKLKEKQSIDELHASMKEKLKNLDQWKKELIQRQFAKEAKVRAAQESSEQRINEVRQIFGYNIDPQNPKFIEALEKKEEEEKKAKKAAKKIEKQKKLIESLRAQAAREAEASAIAGQKAAERLYGKKIVSTEGSLSPGDLSDDKKEE